MNIIVTGAASGIGCRLVTLLARAGHSLIATDLDFARLKAVAAEFYWPTSNVVVAQQDVASARAWAELSAFAAVRFATWDVLVNVAGVLRVEPVSKLKPENVALQLDVNLKGVILGTQAAAERMVQQRRGHIVNVASMAALAPVPGIAVYSATKFAVRGFSLAAAAELEPAGVCVSVVCPDAVDTPMVDYQVDQAGAALTFSGPRILSTDEVARAIMGLLDKPRRELVIPWSRGFVAKTSNLLPEFLRRRLIARLTRKGRARQEALQTHRGPRGA
ncbi:MAG: SDR family NAD(P)-dependent oxidoreductase [Pirellulales bacterium]